MVFCSGDSLLAPAGLVLCRALSDCLWHFSNIELKLTTEAIKYKRLNNMAKDRMIKEWHVYRD
jgi:hypothetical protein